MLRSLFLFDEVGAGFFTDEELAAARTRGDARFLELFGRYAAAHAYGNAETADFQAVCEDQLGQDLTWFFRPWLEEPGHPVLVVDSRSAPGEFATRLTVKIQQVQEDAPWYRMPVQVRYRSLEGERQEVRWLKSELTQWQVDLPPGAWDVQVDPDNWLLERQSRGDLRSPLASGAVVATPNPSSVGFDLRFEVEGEAFHQGEFRVYDSTGRLIRTRDVAFRSPGTLSLFWDGQDDAGRRVPAGIYFARLALGAQVFSKRLVVLP
jgi:hypothetical protein